MGSINLSNSKGRDAMVATVPVRRARRVRYLDSQQRQASTCGVLKSTITCDIDALLKQAGGALDAVAQKLIQSDAEVDVENVGRFLKETRRVFVDQDGKVVHKIKQFEIIRNPDGSERERRPRKVGQPNTATELPLKWSGKLMKKSEVFNRFVFSGKQQIVHINGLTYDFLFGIAKELEEQQSLMFIGAGAKGTSPLIFTRGGQQYRGFLEGRTQGEAYLLVLHLSNMELKAPPKVEAPVAPAPAPVAPDETDAKTQATSPPVGDVVASSAPADESKAKPKRRARKPKGEE
jgi:hypothetical protein